MCFRWQHTKSALAHGWCKRYVQKMFSEFLHCCVWLFLGCVCLRFGIFGNNALMCWLALMMNAFSDHFVIDKECPRLRHLPSLCFSVDMSQLVFAHCDFFFLLKGKFSHLPSVVTLLCSLFKPSCFGVKLLRLS